MPEGTRTADLQGDPYVWALAHAAKVAMTRNPAVIGHWRSECVEFRDRLIDAYRRHHSGGLGISPSMSSHAATTLIP